MTIAGRSVKTLFISFFSVAVLIGVAQIGACADANSYSRTYQLERFDGTAIPVEINMDITAPSDYYIGDSKSKQYIDISIAAEISSEVSNLRLNSVQCYLGQFGGERSEISWFDFVVVEENGTQFDVRCEVRPNVEMEGAQLKIEMSWVISYLNGTTESLGGFTVGPSFGPFSISKGSGYYTANIMHYIPVILVIVLALIIVLFIMMRQKNTKQR